MLELTGISHRFGENWVLKDQNLTLQSGERLAIMGPSGCGKTTLLRIALGLLEQSAGTVKRSFTTPGAVFQEPRLLPDRTALENVNLVLGDSRKTLEKAAYYLEILGLADAGNKLPRALSGGMQQRVALARALAMEGDILILDEPFKALDEKTLQLVIDRVDTFPGALLLVTHGLAHAQALGCKIHKIEP